MIVHSKKSLDCFVHAIGRIFSTNQSKQIIANQIKVCTNSKKDHWCNILRHFFRIVKGYM